MSFTEMDRKIFEREVRLPGHGLCPGCTGAIAERMIFNTLKDYKIIFHGPGVCAGGGTALLKAPNMVEFLTGTGMGPTGISRALKHQGRTDVKVVAIGGDGGALDIGFGKLSAAALRNENYLQFIMDNEAYMNTGIQRSGQTPLGAWTTTTPAGNKTSRTKNATMIMAYHYVPYVATATVGYPQDLINKVKKAITMEGFRYIHVLVPCATGWRFHTRKSIEISKLAVKSGIFPLYEVDHGKFKVTYKPRELIPVKEYTNEQGRFRTLNESQVDEMQRYADFYHKQLDDLDGTTIF
jgi:pyruvate/2-oxoacid:ferredoxin oxidoreductase beta subunit